jgi:hypothetical protein
MLILFHFFFCCRCCSVFPFSDFIFIISNQKVFILFYFTIFFCSPFLYTNTHSFFLFGLGNKFISTYFPFCSCVFVCESSSLFYDRHWHLHRRIIGYYFILFFWCSYECSKHVYYTTFLLSKRERAEMSERDA